MNQFSHSDIIPFLLTADRIRCYIKFSNAIDMQVLKRSAINYTIALDISGHIIILWTDYSFLFSLLFCYIYYFYYHLSPLFAATYHVPVSQSPTHASPIHITRSLDVKTLKNVTRKIGR